MTTRRPLTLAPGLCALALGLAAAAPAPYSSVDVTLTQNAGEMTVSLSNRVTPTLGVANPTVRGGVAYVSARHDVGSWSVGLSPKLPVSLNVKHDTGTNTLNLSGLNVPRLNVNQGAGETNILFGGSTTATVRRDVGALNLYLPANTGLKLTVTRLGTGSVTVEGREVASGTDQSGTYQTANYAAAARKVNLTVTQNAGSIEVFRPGTPLPR